MKFRIFVTFIETFLQQSNMNMQMSEFMMSSPHNFPCILFTEMTKIP